MEPPSSSFSRKSAWCEEKGFDLRDAKRVWVLRQGGAPQNLSQESHRQVGLSEVTYLGSGGEGDVFGFGPLAVKVSRWSLLRFAGSFLSRHAWRTQIQKTLGDLVLPFEIIPNIKFKAPDPRSKAEGKLRLYHKKNATVSPKVREEDFLDVRFYRAQGVEAARLLRLQHELLIQIHRRGFVMMDFIMKNFVFYHGKLVVADAGLLIPAKVMWEMTPRVTSWFMRRALGQDYLQLLAQKKAHTKNPEEIQEMDQVMEALPRVLKAVCGYQRLALEPPCPVRLPERCREAFLEYFDSQPSLSEPLPWGKKAFHRFFSFFSMQSGSNAVKTQENLSHESI